MEEEKVDLLVDEDYAPALTEQEAEGLKGVIEDFVTGLDKKSDIPVEDYITEKMHSYLPEMKEEELRNDAKELIKVVDVYEEKSESLQKSLSEGKSKESWLSGELQRAVSFMTAQEAMKYLGDLDQALETANEKLMQTISTQSGLISSNPNLDGYIAEQYHAQTFNMNAAATGSPYRAEVVEPGNAVYNKNGVDIVIKDGNGKIVSRYQSKYCKDSAATEKAFEKGDYRGQQKLVPSDQEIGKKSSDVLRAPDGTTSNPLSKVDAKKMQEEAQSGKWNDLNWNEYAMKDITIGIAKRAGGSAAWGAFFGACGEIVSKIRQKEEIKVSAVAKAALKGGATAGLKTTIACALKVAVEKGVIKCIPKGTPLGVFSTVACLGVDCGKVIVQAASGKLSPIECVDKVAETVITGVAGVAASSVGNVVGAAIGGVLGTCINVTLGPVGATIGSFLGGVVAHMAGSVASKKLYEAGKKIGKAAIGAAKSLYEKGKRALGKIKAKMGFNNA